MIIHSSTTTDFAKTVKLPSEKTREKELADTPWQVVVYNDPVNLMSYVTMVFRKVFGYDKAKAQKHMMEVHNIGLSILWEGKREEAELYVYQLQTWQLRAQLQRGETSK
jgi:ATP-dependent Clp protease adaptor protein ClpS